MSNPRLEFFTTSLDKDANRELARLISEEIIERIRPKEAIYSQYAFDDLIELAAQDKVAQVGTGRKNSFGVTELLMMVVVPLVTSALTTLFIQERVAGIDGLEHIPQELHISREQIEAIMRQTRVRVNRREMEKLVVVTNQILYEELKRRIPSQSPNYTRCCGYDCATLREFLTNTFNRDELHQLCFDLNEDGEDVLRETLSGSVVSMLEYFIRRGRVCELLELARRRRPLLDWPPRVSGQ